MNVVDSSAWLEYFAGGPNAEAFAGAIEDTARLVVPTIVLLEVYRRLSRQRGEEAALLRLGYMRHGHIVPLNQTVAIQAARIGVGQGLALADSVILATARAFDATLWTQDADFSGIPGVWYYPKKASPGGG
jgi:predicted nucleic acid-binding protein